MKQKMTSHHSEVAQDASGQPVATMATTTGSGSKDPSNNPQAQLELAEDDSDSGSLRCITSSLTCNADEIAKFNSVEEAIKKQKTKNDEVRPVKLM